MHIPAGYTQEQVLETISKILNSLAPKYAFGIHSKEDIKQEGFIIALQALESYNNSFPLENFLRVLLSHRLKNFKRNNSFRINVHCTNCDKFNPDCKSCETRQKTQTTKKNLLSPIDIDVVKVEGESNMIDYDPVDTLDLQELVEHINKHLPAQYRRDYLKMKEGMHIPKSRKLEIESIVKKLMDEYYGE